MKYRDISVLTKEGKYGEKYTYRGTLSYQTKFLGIQYWKSADFVYETEYLNTSYPFYKLSIFDKRGSSLPVGAEEFSITKEIIVQGKSLRSKDDCCMNPDIVINSTTNETDVILDYITWSTDCEILEYSFEYSESGDTKNYFWVENKEPFIKFTCRGEYCYHINAYGKVNQKACLSCGTCFNTEKAVAIHRFQSWFDKEILKRERQKKAKGICGVV